MPQPIKSSLREKLGMMRGVLQPISKKLLYGIIYKPPTIISVTPEAISCPTCKSSKSILWQGMNSRGQAQCRCICCQKNFCHHPAPAIKPASQTAASEGLPARKLPWQTFRRAFRIS